MFSDDLENRERVTQLQRGHDPQVQAELTGKVSQEGGEEAGVLVKEVEAGSNSTQGLCGSGKECLLCLSRALGLMPSAIKRGEVKDRGATEVDSKEQVGADDLNLHRGS